MTFYNIFIVLSCVLAFIVYRVVCLRKAQKYENRVYNALESLYSSEDISQRTKDYAHWQYRNFRSLWFFVSLPVLPLVYFAWKFCRLVKGQSLWVEDKNPDLNKKLYKFFYSNMCALAFVRRPISVTVSLFITIAIACICLALFLFISFAYSVSIFMLGGKIEKSGAFIEIGDFNSVFQQLRPQH